jgi:Uma2 family endonuclease
MIEGAHAGAVVAEQLVSWMAFEEGSARGRGGSVDAVTSRTRPSVVNFDAPDDDYPYTEEMPPVDGRHWHACTNVATPLRAWLRDKPGGARTWVSTHRQLFYNLSGDCCRAVPDVAVYFDVDAAEQERRDHYSVWETGVAPAWVLEVAMRHHDYSAWTVNDPRDADLPDYARLLIDHNAYAALGVAEFWRTDPTEWDILTPRLQGYRLDDGQWHPIPVSDEADTLHGHSDALGLDLRLQDGELRFYDPAAETWLPTYDELLAARIAAEARADQHAAAAASAGARAERAEAELAALRGEASSGGRRT